MRMLGEARDTGTPEGDRDKAAALTRVADYRNRPDERLVIAKRRSPRES